MRAMDLVMQMLVDMLDAMREMPNKEIDKRSKLSNKFVRLINKGDEGLLELCDWIEYADISDEDALLFLSDYLEIEL